jgi:succinate-semialdehyde dehydrogenase/glutarate-semialdehyde dehydrogenase
MQSLLIGASQVEPVIGDPRVRLVTLIGSEKAGRQVASTAGSNITKTLMELGGSDPFIVFADADLDKASEQASHSRLRNQGQSCNAGKRFIIQKSVEKEFLDKIKVHFASQVFGDPTNPETTFGPLGSLTGLNEVKTQVAESVNMGAKVLLGGHDQYYQGYSSWDQFLLTKPKGYFYPPTILTEVTPQMPIFRQEVFGPAAAVCTFESVDEAIGLANDSELGLGASVWTNDDKIKERLTRELEAGMVAINSIVRSHIKLPYGGVKNSGYGREMGSYGLKEFVNIKSVYEK